MRNSHESDIQGFRVGILVCRDAEVVDFASPFGVLSIARRVHPQIDVLLIAENLQPVSGASGFTVVPNYGFSDRPQLDVFLIPGGPGLRSAQHNGNLHAFIRELPPSTILASVCTGSWVYPRMGLLDGIAATNRKNPDRLESQGIGKVPIEQLKVSRRPAGRVEREPWMRGALWRAASRREWSSASISCVGPDCPRS